MELKIKIMKTLIDELKKEADILVEYANGGSFTINIQNKSIKVEGRGVKDVYNNGFVEVSENKLNQLSRNYNVQTNF